jgi:undecaprenyl diphosphate synthase
LSIRGGKRAHDEDAKIQKHLRSTGAIPAHIAIIMDGNGRWAKKRSLPRIAGHREGVETVRDIVEACGELGIKYLTLYTFSTENWKRPKDEISLLMRLLMKSLRKETDKLREKNVRVLTIGDITSMPEKVQNELHDATEKTKHNTGLQLSLALSYSGRWDLTCAVRQIVNDVVDHKLKANDITEETITQNLSTKEIPDPDLLIRTSGEFRISNFLLWQLAYSEFYISDVYWPEFRRKYLYDAIRSYQERERRFGMVSEQIHHHSAKRTKKNFNNVSGI